jgi:DNA-binding MarR family transcriptional regulator
MVSLIRCHRNLVNVVEDELRPYRLNLTSYLLLTTLRLSPAGTEVIGALARRLCVHASTAALALDRLEARDLVRRDPHPTDRRAICVTVTKSGHRLGRAATDALRFVDFGIPEDPHTITELGQILDVLLASAAGEARRAG